MKVTKVEYHHDLAFDKYLEVPGVSFSSLKEKITVTPAMNLGSHVHNYLLEPQKYKYENFEIVAPIAAAIRKIVNPELFDCEVSVTASFEHAGFMLPFKGRIDLLAPKRMVIDLKILAGSLSNAIEYFKYDRQVSGYCYAVGADTGIIIAFNKYTRKVEVKAIKPCAKFWEQIVITKGEPIHN